MPHIIKQKIDLQAENPPMLYNTGLQVGDALAHTWRVRVTDNGVPADLSGGVCKCYFTRPAPKETEADPDFAMVLIEGTVTGSVCEATFPAECYAYPGACTAIMRVTRGESIVTMAVLTSRLERRTSDKVVDPGGIVPSLDVLLALVDRIDAAIKAANDGAKRAEKSAEEADAATQAAQDATKAAREVTDRFSNVGIALEILSPSSDPTVRLIQTATKTTFAFGLPSSDLAYSTFEVNDGMELVMTSPDGFSDIGFELSEDGDLEVVIN